MFLNIMDFVHEVLGSEQFLLVSELFSFFCKLYLLIILVKNSFKSSISKYLFVSIIIFLVGALLSDIAWIMLSIKHILNLQSISKFLTFLARIAWATFITQNQALAFFINYSIDRKFKIKIYDIIFFAINIIISIGFLYLAFFKFYIPSNSLETLGFEILMIQISCAMVVPILMPVLLKIVKNFYEKKLPNILLHQLKIFIIYLILPHIFLELVTNKLFIFYPMLKLIPFNENTLLAISSILCNYAIYYCSKSIMGLRFLNLSMHVESKKKFNFINDFKEILEQLSYVTAIKELAHLTQIFFKAAFGIPVGRTRLYLRKNNIDQNESNTYHDIIEISNKVENFLIFHDGSHCPIASILKQQKVFIKDEIEFSNFFDEQKDRTDILKFLNSINADIFLPIYEQQNISAYIIIERNARPGELYNNSEKDEMLVFTSYLSNIINILKNNNLEALIRKEKELEEELFQKHQEINQYKESIRSFLKTHKERKIGIIFHKNRKFTIANQAAQELLDIDINIEQGHYLTISLKEVTKKVQEYKSSQTTFTKDSKGNRLVINAIPSFEEHNVIIMIYYPEISDIIKAQFDSLKDPSKWDYLLYLESTKSGQLINQLIPGNSEIILNFKINLLQTALSKKATLLQMPEDDLTTVVEIIHHISLRQTLHTLKLTSPEKNEEVMIKIFGINPLLESAESTPPLLQKLDNIGTLFIENVHYLSLETQNYLAEFISYGYYHKFKSDHKYFSNIRIICSTTKNLNNLVMEGLFSKNLFNELKKTSLSMPSLSNLPETEISELADGFTEQALQSKTFKNLLDLTEKEKKKIIDQRPVSLQELKEKVHQILVSKSQKNEIDDKTEFDAAYHIPDPQIAQAVRLGKKALKDPQIMALLWDKFKNQNKIAILLGVNRSSVNRRCQEYKLL